MPDRAPSPLDRALLALATGPIGQVAGTAIGISSYLVRATRGWAASRLARRPRRGPDGRR